VASKKERQAAAKKRDKRSKIALIACGVALLGVGVYEVPSILKMMNKKPPSGNTTYDPGPSTTVGGAPLPNVAAGASTASAVPAASKGDLIDTDVPPASAAGQLVTFEVFQTKNPFAPQVKSSQSSDSSSSSSSASPASPTTANRPGADVPSLSSLPTLPTIPTIPGATTTTPTLPGAGTTGSQGQGIVPPTSGSTTTTTQTTTTTAPAPTVSISVNGIVSRVSTNGTFPSGAPVFRLEGYGHGTAQIGIVGGSYQAGGSTLTLRQGEPVTLENSTDGKRYTVRLLSTP
jgi:hypothetical protein